MNYPSVNTITFTQNDILIKPVTMQEILQVIKEMSSDKAPRPDGFQAFFFQNFWSIIHKDVFQVALFVFNEGCMPSKWKRTFITFIPKKSNPIVINDYRLISLCIPSLRR